MNRIDREIRNKLLVTGFKEGITIADLAKEQNLNEDFVRLILKRLIGNEYKLLLKSKKKGRKTDIVRNNSIVNDYLGNVTFDQITDKHGISHERIRQILVETMGDKYKNIFKENLKLKKEQGLEKFMSLVKELGRIPNAIECKNNEIGSQKQYLDFRKAAKLAGYKKMKQVRKKKFSNEQLISDLKQLAEKLGRTPCKSDLANIRPNLWSIYYLRFGGLGNAQKLAGLIPNKKGYNKFTYRRGPNLVTKQECIDDFKSIYAHLGRKPTYDEVRVNGKYGISTYRKYLGTFDNAWEKIKKGKL